MSEDKTPLPKPPQAYRDFVDRFPELAEAWDLLHRGGDRAGTMDPATQRLVKLALAVGSRQVGAVHSSVRKARALGVPRAQLEQVAALSAASMGLPAAVAAYGWIREAIDGDD